MRRDWTAGPIAVALCAALVAVGALWLSYDRWPRGTAQAALWAVLTAACVWRAGRNLRAELDAARRLLDAWNSSEARDELAQSPPAGTPSVELYDWGQESAGLYPAAEIPRRPTLVNGYAPGGPVEPPHLVVPEGATGWLGPEDVTFERPAESAAARLQAIIDHHLPAVTSPMTVAETDRLVAQLQALPGENERMTWASVDSIRSLTEDSARERWKLAERMGLVRETTLGDLVDGMRSTGHLGQPCNVCGAPATSWVSDRPDPEISDVTFLCDEHYADRMSEEDGR